MKFESESDFSGFIFKGTRWDKEKKCICVNGEAGSEPASVESPEIPVADGYDHLITSWNAYTPAGSCLTIYAQGRIDGRWSKWYILGIWNRGNYPRARTSVRGQGDDDGTVDTDVMKLKKLADAFRIKVEFASADGEIYPNLRFIAVNVIDSSKAAENVPPLDKVWGTELDVPELCQISVPGGEGWCSPTSTAMVLGYWSKKLNRPELTVGITETAQACHDDAWGGTGNWPFNTAHAGEFPGIRAYVTRFTSVTQIEQWIEKGVPVIVSVNYGRLKRKERENESGHLMVIRGFTKDGDPIFNDPWAELDKGETLRKVFKREDLEFGWLGPQGSWGTVYMIHPENWVV